MFKVKKILYKNIDLPCYILHYISLFLTKYDIIYETRLIDNYYLIELKLRQRHRKKKEFLDF